MKFSIEKAALEDAINTVIRAVPAKASIPAMEGILMSAWGEELTVTAYNNAIGIRTTTGADVSHEGDVVINAKLLSDIIRKLPSDTVTLDCDEDMNTKVSCASTHYNVIAYPAGDYPTLPDIGETEGFPIKEGALKSMLAQTTFAVSTNETRPVQAGSLFDVKDGELNVVACDGFRLAMRTETVEAPDMEFVVPGTALTEVERLCESTDAEAKISVGARHIMFLVGVTELITRRLDGAFLDYKTAIPKNNPVIVKVNAKSMMTSIDRVSVVVNEKLKSPIRCIVGDGEIKMSAKTATGAAQDKCSAEGDGGGMEIGFNGRYLYEAFKYCSEPVVNMAFKNNTAPAVITGISGDGTFLQMVLPVRLKQE